MRAAAAPSMTVAVAAAGALEQILGEPLFLVQREVLSDGPRTGPVYRDARLAEARESACTDAAHHDRVDLLVVQRLDRIAGAVGVVLVTVVYRGYRIRVGVHDDECRGGPEMIEHRAGHALIDLYGETYFHGNR